MPYLSKGGGAKVSRMLRNLYAHRDGEIRAEHLHGQAAEGVVGVDGSGGAGTPGAAAWMDQDQGMGRSDRVG